MKYNIQSVLGFLAVFMVPFVLCASERPNVVLIIGDDISPDFSCFNGPIGTPYNIGIEKAPSAEDLEQNTLITYSDMDGGPTKAFLVLNRNNQVYAPYYHRAFDKRPREELYDLQKDPDQIHNIAGDSRYRKIQAELNQKLMDELTQMMDPRVMGDGSTFDNPPYLFERN